MPVVTYPPGSVCIDPKVGTLTIDGIPIRSPAWGITDLSALTANFTTRGENGIIPGAAGERPLRFVRAAMTAVPLRMLISGVCDPTGAMYPDDEDGLYWNMKWLRTNLPPPVAPAPPYYAAELDTPPGELLHANVQVRGFDRGAKTRGLFRGVMYLTVMSGEFV